MLRLSLRTKQLLGVLVILGPILALLLYGFQAEYLRRREAVLTDLTQASQAVAALMDATFDEAIAVGWAIASEPAVQSLDPALIVSQLSRLAPRYPQYENLAVLDAQGELRGESAEELRGTARSFGDRPYFQQVLATEQPTTIGVVMSRRTGRPATGAAVPIVGADGRLLGVVRITFDPRYLEARLEGVGLLPGQAIVVTDQMGRLAVHSAVSDVPWAARDLSATPEVQAALQGQVVQTTDFRSQFLGDVRAAAFVLTPRYGWVVSVSWPVAQAFGPLEEALRLALLAFAAIAVLSTLGAVLLANYLVGPVGRLAAQARALGQGDLGRRVEIKTGDELEELGRNFNTMAERLQGTLQALEARAGELGAVATAARAVVRELNLEAVASAVVEQAKRVLGADWAILWLANLERGELRLIAHLDVPPPVAAALQTVPLASALPVAQAARTGQVVAIEDLLEATGFPEAQALAEREGVRGILRQPLTFHGRLVGVLGVATTLPRRFGPEELRLAAALGDLFAAAVENAQLFEQVREALRLREEFLAAAAHELRTPATSLKGYVQLLQRRGPPHDALEQRALAHIGRAAERATRLARELVEVHELAREPMRLQRGPLDLLELVQERVQAVQAGAERHRFLVCAAGSLAVEADRARLALAVEALLENAVRYQPQAGAVHVTVAEAPGEAVVEVRDFGVGIPADRLPRVFEPLFEPWPAGSSHYVGVVGLGMYLAHRIIEAHGGRIEAASQVGEGSVFRLHLPKGEGRRVKGEG